MSVISERKSLGQFYTPTAVAHWLVRWAVRHPTDRILDPSCGNGEFLVHHDSATGIDVSEMACCDARTRAPAARIHQADFFEWADGARSRYDAVVGNPPFIRYHHFNGEVRRQAAVLSRRLNADFSGLASSWAHFLVVASGLLVPGGRLAFVVPAEIGHATYARPVIEFLLANFEFVNIVAVRDKIFPDISEDAWLLYAEGYGGTTCRVGLKVCANFAAAKGRPVPDKWVSVDAWRESGYRLRKFLLPTQVLEYYEGTSSHRSVVALSAVAKVGIGYVTGDNSFFHLSQSRMAEWRIPEACVRVAVRNGAQLRSSGVDKAAVKAWLAADREVLLLALGKQQRLPKSVQAYLDSEEGQRARHRYKCRMRNPWYAVPDIHAPDAFLTYMNGRTADLVANKAGCVCTNSLLSVRLADKTKLSAVVRGWQHPLSRLSQELEGHPLGGGMLKIEPGEAARVKVPLRALKGLDSELFEEGIGLMRRWRHYD